MKLTQKLTLILFSNILSPSMSACRLCTRQARLSKSHIIPEFCYAGLYDQNHRFIEVHDVKRGRVHRGQKGHTERLLCAECESHLNGFERHARRLFVDRLEIGTPPRPWIELENLEYAKLKLFLLSVVWRSSVSSLHIFRHVDLGRHEPEFRRRILHSEPGVPGSYGVMIFPLLFNGEHMRDLMIEPTPGRLVGGNWLYRFVFTGFVFLMIVSSHSVEPRFAPLLLNDNAPVRVYPRELRDFQFLREVWNLAGETIKDVVI